MTTRTTKPASRASRKRAPRKGASTKPWPSVQLYIGGCTGSSNPQMARIMPPNDGSTKVLTRPVERGAFGTNTTSLALVVGSTAFLIDNGSGVAQAAEFISARGAIETHVLQTHYHLDHTSGIPTNPLFLDKSRRIGTIASPILNGVSLAGIMDRFFDPAIWPISPKTFGIQHSFTEFKPGETLPIFGGIETFALSHPGGSVAYRIKTPLGDVVIATDSELSDSALQENFARFIDGARLLYADVQYRDSEYEGTKSIGGGNTRFSRKTWGHSTPEMLWCVLHQCSRPPHVVIGHHDPKRSEADLTVFEEEVQKSFVSDGITVEFARECKIVNMKPGSV